MPALTRTITKIICRHICRQPCQCGCCGTILALPLVSISPFYGQTSVGAVEQWENVPMLDVPERKR
uniref:Uncharacterized protein n=1 Tax=Anguilla anguilla TaxID=7936 RepID=A0A0E9UXL7_ANGAN